MTNARSLLAGQTAIVTGASSGIGREVSRALTDAGVRVAMAGRDEARLREAAPDETAMLVECDVREAAQVRAMVERVTSEWGAVDILVNSAGVFYVAPLPETTDDMWDELWRTNVSGTFFAARAVLPGMLERGRGTIVMLSSVAAHRGFANTSGYSATKHASGWTGARAHDGGPPSRRAGGARRAGPRGHADLGRIRPAAPPRGHAQAGGGGANNRRRDLNLRHPGDGGHPPAPAEGDLLLAEPLERREHFAPGPPILGSPTGGFANRTGESVSMSGNWLCRWWLLRRFLT